MADGIQVDSSIESVVVFPDKAQIQRRLNVKCVKGINRVQLALASDRILLDSFHVEGIGSELAQILNVMHAMRLSTARKNRSQSDEETETKLKELQERLEAEEMRRAEVESEWTSCRQSLQVVESYALNVHKVPDGKTLLDTDVVNGLGSFLKVMNTQRNEYDRKRIQLEKQAAKLDMSLKRIRDEIRELDSPPDTQAKLSTETCVTIVIESELEQELELKCQYLVQGAQWKPRYDIRVNSQKNEIEIAYKAVISQSTGEDWRNVHLSLSTAKQITTGTSQPKFDTPWRIDIVQKPQPSLMSREKSGSTYSFGGQPSSQTAGFGSSQPQPALSSLVSNQSQSSLLFGATAFGAPTQATTSLFSFPATSQQPQQQQTQPRAVENASTSVHETASIPVTTFKLTAPQTIPSSIAATPQFVQKPSTQHTVTIKTLTFPTPDFTYTCTPKLSQRVYFSAELTNNSEYVLLAGPCSIYVDNNFILSSHLCPTGQSHISTGEKFQLDLGVDPSVRVEYPPMTRVLDQVGLVTKYNVLHCTQRIVMRNSKSVAVQVDMEDQVPVSVNAKQVNVTVVDPPQAKQQSVQEGKDKDLGIIKWLLKLDAHEVREIVLKYDVTYPLEERLNGLA